MKSIAILQQSHEINLIDTSVPPIKSNQILIKTLVTGICSTERELLDQEIVPPGKDDFLILGHEAIGEVVEVGADVSEYQKGDIVVPTVRRGCGACPFCKNGRSDMCGTGEYKERGILGLHGFMSEYFIEEETNLTKIPEQLKTQGVLLEPLTVGIKAVEEYAKIQKSRLCIPPDLIKKQIFRNALIVGAGPIGLLAALVLACHNVKIACIDIDKEGGAKSDITRMMEGQYLNIHAYIENDGIHLARFQNDLQIGKIDLMIDASPDPTICLQLIDVLNFNGVIVHLGLPYGKKASSTDLIDHYISSLVYKNAAVLGSVNANRTNFSKGCRYLEKSQKKYSGLLDNIITHRFNYTDYQEAFSVNSFGRIKVVLDWQAQ